MRMEPLQSAAIVILKVAWWRAWSHVAGPKSRCIIISYHYACNTERFNM